MPKFWVIFHNILETGRTPILLQYTSSLQRWLICNPEIAGFLNDFEGTHISSNEAQEHHNSSISAQSSFQEDLKLLFLAIDEVENSFSDGSYDLHTLDTKYVVPEDVLSSTLPNVQERGEKQTNSWNQVYEIGLKQYLILWPKLECNSSWKRHSTTRNVISCSWQETSLLFFWLIYLLSGKGRRLGTLL